MRTTQSHTTATGRGIHLIVLIHGLYGNPDNLAVVKEELERAGSSSASSSSSSSSATVKSSDRKGKAKEATAASSEDEDEYDLIEDVLDLDEAGSAGSPRDLVVEPGSPDSGSRNRLELKVFVCRSFTGSHTWDGIDVNAHRASKEIDQEITRLKGEGKAVEVFSIVSPPLSNL